jgi:hypothetical protein
MYSHLLAQKTLKFLASIARFTSMGCNWKKKKCYDRVLLEFRVPLVGIEKKHRNEIIYCGYKPLKRLKYVHKSRRLSGAFINL